MKLHLGANPEQPTITAQLAQTDYERLGVQMPEFLQAADDLAAARHSATTITDDEVAIEFRLARIGRRPTETHEDYLLPVVTLLDGLSCLEDDEADPLKRLVIDLYGVPGDGRRTIDATLAWPQRAEQEVSTEATLAMRLIAKQLAYDLREWNQSRYREHIGVEMKRHAAHPGEVSGVSIIANAQGSSSSETDGDAYDPAAPEFDLHTHNVYSRKQQLIILGGMIAVAFADTAR